MMTRLAGLVPLSFVVLPVLGAACRAFGADDTSGTPAPPSDAAVDSGTPPITGEPGRGLEVRVGDSKATAFVMQGRALSLPVKLTRKETTTGPVTITVSKLPKGVTADPLVVPAGAVDAMLTLHAALAPASEQGPAALDITALEAGDRPAGATTKLSAFVRGTPGALDTTFGTTGVLLTPYGLGSDSSAQDAKALRNGSTLIGARRVSNIVLSRFTAAGLLDTSFAGGGTTNVTVSQSAVLLDVYEPPSPAKGFIYLLETGTQSPSLYHLNLDGSLDTGFNASGKVVVDDGLGGVSQASQVLVLPDGKALVVATHPITSTTAVTRWSADGTRDESYGIAGTCQIAGTAPRMVLRPGGAVYVSVKRTSGTGGAVQGCTAAGVLDTTVGSGPNFSYEVGPDLVDFARTYDGGLAFVRNDGIGPGAPYATWSRVNASFVPDTTIGLFGEVRAALPAASGFIVGQDGGVLIGGAVGPDFKIVRYSSKGMLDADFGAGGTASFNVAETNTADLIKLVAQPDGRVLAIGKHYDTADAVILRFWP